MFSKSNTGRLSNIPLPNYSKKSAESAVETPLCLSKSDLQMLQDAFESKSLRYQYSIANKKTADNNRKRAISSASSLSLSSTGDALRQPTAKNNTSSTFKKASDSNSNLKTNFQKHPVQQHNASDSGQPKLSKPPQRRLIQTPALRKPIINLKQKTVSNTFEEEFNNEALDDILNCESSKDLDTKLKKGRGQQLGSGFERRHTAGNNINSVSDVNVKRASIYAGPVITPNLGYDPSRRPETPKNMRQCPATPFTASKSIARQLGKVLLESTTHKKNYYGTQSVSDDALSECNTIMMQPTTRKKSSNLFSFQDDEENKFFGNYRAKSSTLSRIDKRNENDSLDNKNPFFTPSKQKIVNPFPAGFDSNSEGSPIPLETLVMYNNDDEKETTLNNTFGRRGTSQTPAGGDRWIAPVFHNSALNSLLFTG